jgi:hypothetical protein
MLSDDVEDVVNCEDDAVGRIEVEVVEVEKAYVLEMADAA